MQRVGLEGLKFRAYHGYYDEERQRGNEFLVDIFVETDFTKAASTDDLTQAVNYEDLYLIVKDEMEIPSKLLEHVVYRIAERVLTEVPAVNKVCIELKKKNPPIGGDCAAAKVVYEKSRG